MDSNTQSSFDAGAFAGAVNRSASAMPRRFADALLVVPPTGLYRRDDRCQNRVEEQTVRVVLPPLGLAYAAAFLREAGVSVRLRDFPAERGGWADFLDELTAPVDLLVVQASAPTIAGDYRAFVLARERHPAIATLALTSIFAENAASFLEAHPAVDAVLRSEADRGLFDLGSGVDPADIHGLAFRRDSEIRVNPLRRERIDFSCHPPPARDLFRNDLYRSPLSGRRMTIVETSRGCPFKCVFCPAHTLSGGRLQQRPVEAVLDEIASCVRDFGIREFLFEADTFTLDRPWVMNFSRRIRESGLDIAWAASTRLDSVDEGMLRAMKDAGCYSLGFGIESGNDEHLRRMQKNLSAAQVRAGIALCKRVGIRTHAFFVIGLPWDTKESIADTFRFARELRPDFTDFNIAFPIPNTEFRDQAIDEGLVESAISDRGYSDSPVRTRTLSHADLVRMRRSMLLSMYLRPGYVWRTLRREATSPARLGRVFAAGARRLAQLVSI
ncbi:B12-binding domain-containing radical SAM protein [bacterium]|nr:B12-binding domain-containing radical SAM protein [bacterium]